MQCSGVTMCNVLCCLCKIHLFDIISIVAFLFFCSRARPAFAIWAMVQGILKPDGYILMADAKGETRANYKYPVRDGWFKIKREFMRQKGLSLWSVEKSILQLNKQDKERKFEEWLEQRDLE